MANTKDMRTLKEYKEHFKKYNRLVNHKQGLRNDTIGIIDTDDNGLIIFKPLLNKGRNIYENNIVFKENSNNNEKYYLIKWKADTNDADYVYGVQVVNEDYIQFLLSNKDKKITIDNEYGVQKSIKNCFFYQEIKKLFLLSRNYRRTSKGFTGFKTI